MISNISILKDYNNSTKYNYVLCKNPDTWYYRNCVITRSKHIMFVDKLSRYYIDVLLDYYVLSLS